MSTHMFKLHDLETDVCVTQDRMHVRQVHKAVY